MARYNNLEELEAGTVGKAFLVPADISGVLKCDPYAISLMARDDTLRPKLGFSVIIIGKRTKIPRKPFLDFMKGENRECGEVSS